MLSSDTVLVVPASAAVISTAVESIIIGTSG